MSKAVLIHETGGPFQFQYNPKEFTLDESAHWKAEKTFHQDQSILTFDQCKPSVVTLEAIFDETNKYGDVQGMIAQLRSFTYCSEKYTDEDGKDVTRPPYATFKWGNFEFACVMEKMSVTYLMFKPDGTPLRAKVKLTLKERMEFKAGPGSGGNIALTPMQTIIGNGATAPANYNGTTKATSTGADNTQVLAARHRTTLGQMVGPNWRPVAQANNMSNPMSVAPGTQVVNPGNAVVAAAMAAMGYGPAPTNWAASAPAGPYAPGGGAGGLTGFASVFDE